MFTPNIYIVDYYDETNLNVFAFDADTEENYSNPAEATEYPVDNTASHGTTGVLQNTLSRLDYFSDYVVIKSAKYSWKGVVTMTPLEKINVTTKYKVAWDGDIVTTQTTDADGNPLPTPIVTTKSRPITPDRIVQAYNYLIKLQTNKQPVQVFFKYSSPLCWITTCELVHNVETGEAAEISITATEFRTAQSKKIDNPLLGKKVSAGTTSKTSPTSPGTKSGSTSRLKAIKDKVKGSRLKKLEITD
jgi:hypothetical protein